MTASVSSNINCEYYHVNVFINGLGYSRKEAKEETKEIEKIFNHVELGLFHNNATEGFWEGLFKMIFCANDTQKEIEKLAKKFLSDLEKCFKKHKKANINIFAHSQGSEIVWEMLLKLKDKKFRDNNTLVLSRINVIFLGAIANHIKNDGKEPGKPNLFFSVLDTNDMPVNLHRLWGLAGKSLKHIDVCLDGFLKHSCLGYVKTEPMKKIIKMIITQKNREEDPWYNIADIVNTFPERALGLAVDLHNDKNRSQSSS